MWNGFARMMCFASLRGTKQSRPIVLKTSKRLTAKAVGLFSLQMSIFSFKKGKRCIFAAIIGSDTVCLKVRISQIQTKQDRISALRAIIARTAFHIFVSGMREPSLQDRIGVRAFLPILQRERCSGSRKAGYE
jgi:hypothetical protein